jgi:hypothetical protein
MKKLVSVILVGVFALSAIAGILASQAKADPVPLCMFVSCDYQKERVKLKCYNEKSGNTNYVWSYDPEYWARWCE